MTDLTPISENALKSRLHLFSNTQRGNFPTSSPRWSRRLTQPASARMGSPRLAPLWAPSPRFTALKAPRREDGRRGWLWAPAIGGVGAATGRSLRSSTGTQPPTGAGFAPHSPCARARRTMAPVSPRRTASVRPFGLQLPETPAAWRTPRCGRWTSWRPTRGGRRSPGRGKSALGDPAGTGGGLRGASRSAGGSQHLHGRRRRLRGRLAKHRGLQRVGRRGNGEREGLGGAGPEVLRGGASFSHQT